MVLDKWTLELKTFGKMYFKYLSFYIKSYSLQHISTLPKIVYPLYSIKVHKGTLTGKFFLFFISLII